jgi:hypothetical protein
MRNVISSFLEQKAYDLIVLGAKYSHSYELNIFQGLANIIMITIF